MSRLLEQTIRLMKDSPETQREIAQNAGVNYQWLTKVYQGTTPNPGVIQLEKLHDYLVSRQ